MSTMRRKSHYSQRGFTLVWALFLVVIGALISLFMVRISAVQAGSTDLALQGARAWQAAKAGAEWGVARASVGNCAASTAFAMGAESDLSGFDVIVTCSSTTFSEGSSTVTVYTVTSAAEAGTLGTSPDYAYRQTQVTVARQP